MLAFFEPADREKILSQRHTPKSFSDILPKSASISGLNKILNEGYWNAFDNDDLDTHGIPNDEKYLVDEQDRFERVGKYLEIFSKDNYPFADWHSNLEKTDLSNICLLRGQ